MILEKLKELEDLIEVPNVDKNPDESIRAMKILNKIVELRDVVNKNNDIHNVISRFFIFTGKENGEVTKYCVFNQKTDEDAIAEIELSKPNFDWRQIETFK